MEIFKSLEGVLGEEKLIELLKYLDQNAECILESNNGVDKLFVMINTLHRKKKMFSMAMHREDEYPIMLKVEFPNEYWEIEFFKSGEVDVEIFTSDSKIYGEEVLTELLKEFSD